MKSGESGFATAFASKAIATAKFGAVSKVKAAKDGDTGVSLSWSLPGKPALGAVYTAYEIEWVVSKTERKSVAIASSTDTGATVLLSTLTALGIDMASKKKFNFVVRAVQIAGDGVTVANQSLEAKFAITPSKLK